MKLFNLLKNNITLIILFVWFVLALFINIHINIFKYKIYDFGKFDLGNMTQMVWNTLHGRILYLTDYFGGNVPRWSMSHVDPILLIFVPIFALIQHPLTLVFSQILLVLSSAFIIYALANLELKSKVASLFISLAYLFYPAIGYLTAQTGFHGVTAVIFFFLAGFYVMEKMYKENNYTKKRIILFWILMILTMSGKEQIPLYTFVYSVFLFIFRSNKITRKISIWLGVLSIIWFISAFFIIIPRNAHYRIESYQNFARNLGIDTQIARDVENDNYFLSRYEAFGDSYLDIALGIFLDNEKAVRIFFGGDKIKNFNRTFEPLLYLPFFYPQILIISLPDFLINYLTSAGGIGTAEIENHRISMIIPVLFISIIYSISFISSLLIPDDSKKKIRLFINIFISISILGMCVRTTFIYNNPVYLWLNQSLHKRFEFIPIFADFDRETIKEDGLAIGTVHRIANLDNKDIECANKVVNMIPKEASVSGPDYLGAHLSMRETYAIFPALYNTADYVVVDVFSRKIFTILDMNTNAVKDVVGNLLKSDDYQLILGCGNLFVFEKNKDIKKSDILPLQERSEYREKVNYEIFNSLYVVDYSIPGELTRGVKDKAKIAYIRRENKDVADYILYMTYYNTKTEEIYQAANLPSFSIMEPEDWNTGLYYIEDIDIALPKYMDPGIYRVFVGMSNRIRTRNLYLGEVVVK